jgi:hypothetical protein
MAHCFLQNFARVDKPLLQVDRRSIATKPPRCLLSPRLTGPFRLLEVGRRPISITLSRVAKAL